MRAVAAAGRETSTAITGPSSISRIGATGRLLKIAPSISMRSPSWTGGTNAGSAWLALTATATSPLRCTTGHWATRSDETQ